MHGSLHLTFKRGDYNQNMLICDKIGQVFVHDKIIINTTMHLKTFDAQHALGILYWDRSLGMK